jgi:PAS domain S-box-containing protein
MGDRKDQGEYPLPERGSWIFDADKNDLASILDNLPVGVAVLGSPFGNALYINHKVVDTLGYNLSDTPSTRTMFNKALPDLKARREINRLWSQAVKSGAGSLLSRCLCGDGKVRTFENKVVVLRKDLIVNTWMDVTRREAAEAQLRESESRLRSFFENSCDPFLLFDGRRVINCNRAAQQLFGYDRERIMGATLEDLSPEKLPDGALSSLKARALLKAVLKQGSYRFEWTARRGDGKEVPVEVSITTIALEGKALLFAVLRDITASKEAQGALLHAKADLENRVRERTSDLAAINKRLLREIEARKKTEWKMRGSREELRYLSEHLHQIMEQGMAHIAREFHDQLGQSLSAVKIDLAHLREQMSGKNGQLRKQVQEIEKQIGDIMQSVREICRELRPPVLDDFGLPTAIKWHLREVQKKTGMDCIITMDKEISVHPKELSLVIFRIYQEAMTNVLRHAGATRVEVTLKRYENRLVLKVKDNGKGILPEQIMSPSSLGILGIRERVRFWRGRSFFTGSPGKGTMMRVSFPLRPAKPSSKESVSLPFAGNKWSTLS